MTQAHRTKNAIVPAYGIVPLVLAVTFNMAVYVGARILNADRRHYNIESPLDAMIPFWAPSIVIYLGCYLFWVINYILIARQDKKAVCCFFASDLFSRVICLFFFLLVPSTNTRPAVSPDGLWNQLVLMVYSIDAADNLFPSIHCLVSWLCYAGLRGHPRISDGYRRFSCVMAILICLSTQLTKQHVLIDVFGGIAIAELSLWVGKRTALGHYYENMLDKINAVIFPGKGLDK